MKVRDLRKLLNESLFNPKQPGILSTIVKTCNDPNYYEMRAQEYINEGRLSLGENPTPTENQLANYNDRMVKAISLLVLARAIRSQK